MHEQPQDPTRAAAKEEIAVATAERHRRMGEREDEGLNGWSNGMAAEVEVEERTGAVHDNDSFW